MDSFLGDEHGAGKFDSEGEFTLDLVATRRKLAAAQFEKRDFYILKLVQAGVQMGAKRIVIRLLDPEVGVTFEEPEDQSMLDLHVVRRALLNPFKLPHGPLRDIAWGLLSVVTEEAPEIELNTHRQRLRFRDGADRLNELSVGRPHLEIRVWCGVQKEAEVLQEHCRYAPVPIIVNREEVSGRRFPGEHLAECHLLGAGLRVRPPLSAYASREPEKYSRTREKDARVTLYERFGADTEPCRALLVLHRSLDGAAAAYLTKHGVTDSRPVKLPGGIPGAQVVVCGDQFDTDLTGLRLLQNDTVSAYLAEVTEELGEFAERVAAFLNDLMNKAEVSSEKAGSPPAEAVPVLVGIVFGAMAGAWGGAAVSLLGAVCGATLGAFSATLAWERPKERSIPFYREREALERALSKKRPSQ